MEQSLNVLWLDRNTDPELRQRLQDVAKSLRVFSNADACVDYITSSCSLPDSVLLIVSGSLGRELVNVFNDLPQLHAVYVFCFNRSNHISWAKQCSKIGIDRIFDRSHDLIRKLSEDLKKAKTELFSTEAVSHKKRLTEEHSKLPFNLSGGNHNYNSTCDLTKEKVKFLWLQILNYILILMPRLDIYSRQKMVDICRKKSVDNPEDLKLIDEFYSTYVPDQALHWYTRDSFLYKLLNQTLREQNIDTIFKFRLIISDIYNQLNKLFQIQKCSSSTWYVYRGQRMTKAELNRIHTNVNRLISMNSFLSTTRNKSIAKSFATKLDHTTDDTVSVFFEIKLDTQVVEKMHTPFANIQELSCYPTEEEILLSIGTIFRVEQIFEEESSNLWNIRLTMCTLDEDRQLMMLYEHTQAEICTNKNLTFSTYGKFLALMSQFDSATAYLHEILQQLPSDHVDLPTIHNDLAYAYRESRQYEKATKHYNIALDMKEKQIPCNEIEVAITCSDYGWLLMNQNNLEKSFNFHRKALRIREKYLGHNNFDTAMSYNCLGLCYVYMQNFDLALSNLQEALKIRKHCLPPNHPYIAMSYTSLGTYYEVTKNQDEALKMHEKALQIYKCSVPPDHGILASSYKSVASHYTRIGHSQKAVEYRKIASDIISNNGRSRTADGED